MLLFNIDPYSKPVNPAQVPSPSNNAQANSKINTFAIVFHLKIVLTFELKHTMNTWSFIVTTASLSVLKYTRMKFILNTQYSS